jgi:DNA-binding CsgD family transcriptional regulator
MLDFLTRDEAVAGAAPPPRLVVAVQARDAVRVAALSALVAAAGHELGAADEADLLLTDAPAAGRLPALVLSDEVPDGAVSALPENAGVTVLDAAMRAVAAGLIVRAPVRTDGFGAAGVGEEGFEPARPLLTPRELEILGCLGEGLSNKAVARQLGISQHTVKFHLEAVFAKLGANSRAEAVAKGLRGGLLEI